MKPLRNEQHPYSYPAEFMQRVGRVADALRNLDYAVPVRNPQSSESTPHSVTANNRFAPSMEVHANESAPAPLASIVPLTREHELRNLSANALSEAMPRQDIKLDA